MILESGDDFLLIVCSHVRLIALLQLVIFFPSFAFSFSFYLVRRMEEHGDIKLA